MNDILSQILINKANELKKLDKNIIPLKRQNSYDFFQALNSNRGYGTFPHSWSLIYLPLSTPIPSRYL